jgi:hypothetical protein
MTAQLALAGRKGKQMKNTPEYKMLEQIDPHDVFGIKENLDHFWGILTKKIAVYNYANECKKEFGEKFIRVDWQFADVARRMPQLKLVCMFNNGDEGFIYEDTLSPKEKTPEIILPEGKLNVNNQNNPD